MNKHFKNMLVDSKNFKHIMHKYARFDTKHRHYVPESEKSENSGKQGSK